MEVSTNCVKYFLEVYKVRVDDQIPDADSSLNFPSFVSHTSSAGTQSANKPFFLGIKYCTNKSPRGVRRKVSCYDLTTSTLNALGEKVEQLSRIPSCIRIMQKLRDELELYREHAKIEMSKPVLIRKDLWTFWTSHALILPIFFAAASTVALISPSSAVCERLFARLVMGFGDDQENALQDY